MASPLACAGGVCRVFRCLWGAGAGGKAFCAGGDVRSLYDTRTPGSGSKYQKSFLKEEYHLDLTICNLRAKGTQQVWARAPPQDAESSSAHPPPTLGNVNWPLVQAGRGPRAPSLCGHPQLFPRMCALCELGSGRRRLGGGGVVPL